MNPRHDRIRNLGVAGILAVAAGLLAALALPHRGAEKAQAAEPKTATVLVARRDLAVGTSLAEARATHGVVLQRVPADAVGADALHGFAATGGKVVVQQIFAGEQVTARRLGATGAAGLHADLGGDDRVIQIEGDPAELLAGTLHDGDHVDVVASVKVGQNQTPETGWAVRNVLVVDAPAASAADASTASAPTVTATVQLTDAQAKRLFYVMKNGDWAFVLRPDGAATATHTKPVDAGAIAGGE
jgi:Flp pilus assembly protein CpaB